MGLIVVVSSPSGGGKTTVVKRLLKKSGDYNRSISYTTRPAQKGEVNNKDYYFITRERFKKLVKKKFFAEWAEVHGYLYGTAGKTLRKHMNGKKDTFCVIDVKGGLNIKRMFPDSVLIFLLPPAIRELRKRIKLRNRESAALIRKRLKRARFEFEASKKYDYSIVNDKIEKTAAAVESIIKAERYKAVHNAARLRDLIKECG